MPKNTYYEGPKYGFFIGARYLTSFAKTLAPGSEFSPQPVKEYHTFRASSTTFVYQPWARRNFGKVYKMVIDRREKCNNVFFLKRSNPSYSPDCLFRLIEHCLRSLYTYRGSIITPGHTSSCLGSRKIYIHCGGLRQGLSIDTPLGEHFFVLETNKARFVRVDGLAMISFLLIDRLRSF